VLRSLRHRSLARLRHEVEPVEPAALGRFLPAWHGIPGTRRGSEGLLEAIAQLQGAAVPASILESEILPARLWRYEPGDLDALTASGAVVWVGSEPLGPRDGRVCLYLTEQAPLLLAARAAGPNGPLHARLREHLAVRGASFFPQLLQSSGSTFSQEVLDALWDLVWAGEVTNDTLHPLRAYLAPRRGRRASQSAGSRALRYRAVVCPEAAGRWSLVRDLVIGEPTPTERLAARARQLLDRHGVLTREAVHAEGIDGGFASIYGVLRAMEEAGRLRRGYFIAGLGATQFALPGAVDRLRDLRHPGEAMIAAVLAAADPANPYGAALPWPERDDGRKPARAVGATVVLIDGALAAFTGRGERHLLTYLNGIPGRTPADTARAVAHALAGQVTAGKRGALFIREVDGQPVTKTPMAGALAEAGFTYGPQGYMKRL
jgi:ATP-dependent Lhr-like helicase